MLAQIEEDFSRRRTKRRAKDTLLLGMTSLALRLKTSSSFLTY